MGVTDFLNTLSQTQANAPLISSSKNTAPTKYGATLANSLAADKSVTAQGFQQQQQDNAATVAARYSSMAAGTKGLNQFGVSDSTPLSTSDYQNQGLTALGTVNQIGKNALAASTARSDFQKQQQAINNAAGFQVNFTASSIPGASADNPGAKAVAIAMQAYNNKTPYVWSGNSLTKGVDCSGLVQQAYAQLGIKLPRTTYEQAKSGQTILGGIDKALPGDLIFYNTGSRDPNGIGTLSHVAIYLGNGKVLEANNPREGITIDNFNYNGAPARIVRPWS